jgi:acetolactate synthase-1/3 small subunit
MVIDQIKKQVDKLVDVVRVVELMPERAVFRELALIKVTADKKTRVEIISIVDTFRGKVIDIASETVTIEITGDQNKVAAFIAAVEDYGIKEIVRTGLTGLCRGNNPIKKVKEDK